MSSAAKPKDLTAYISSLRERIAAFRELAQTPRTTKLRQIELSLEADADQLQKA